MTYIIAIVDIKNKKPKKIKILCEAKVFNVLKFQSKDKQISK